LSLDYTERHSRPRKPSATGSYHFKFSIYAAHNHADLLLDDHEFTPVIWAQSA